MSKPIHTIADLTPDPRNANKGTERGAVQLEKSLEELGFGRPVVTDKNRVLIGGNKTVEMAASLGYTEVEEVHTRGDKLIVHVRDDLDLMNDPRARKLAIADNRVGEVDLAWDADALQELQDAGVELEEWWRDDELEEMLGEGEPGGDESGDSDSDGEPNEKLTCPVCGFVFAEEG